ICTPARAKNKAHTASSKTVQLCLDNSASSKRDFEATMVRLLMLLLLLLLPHTMCKGRRMKCPAADPIFVPHEWGQAGDLFIGGIVTQSTYVFNEVSFTVHPSQELFDVPQ
ncbi:Hypothetical predicted protein, partial [Podarcis lilfordi]